MIPSQPDIPSGYSPPPKEGENRPLGFSIRVETSDLIFNAIQKNKSGELGAILLANPVQDVEVELESEKGSFDLVGRVATTFEYRHDFESTRDRRRDPANIIRNIAAKHRGLGEVKERGGGKYVVTGANGSQFVLEEDSLDRILISTGNITSDHFSERRLLPKPTADRQTFDATMADFTALLKETVDDLYEDVGVNPPNEQLVIGPPKREIESMGGPRTSLAPEELMGKLEIEVPDVTFDQIGGQPDAKREIQGLAFAISNPELYLKWGTKPPKGVILYGPPGTGKTLMAKALASQADARFFHVSASDIGSKWYGESEQIVQKIFELANNNGDRTIIFFDELDAIAPDREGAHEATHKVISTLLENMDGLESNENVMVVASTNRLDSIDPALVRAGRFDRWVEVPLPDEEGRRQILEIHMKRAETLAGRSLFSDMNLDIIASKTEKSSGADLAEIIRRVLEEKVRQEGTGQEPGSATTEDMLREIKGYERVKETRKTIGFRPIRQEPQELS